MILLFVVGKFEYQKKFDVNVCKQISPYKYVVGQNEIQV